MNARIGVVVGGIIWSVHYFSSDFRTKLLVGLSVCLRGKVGDCCAKETKKSLGKSQNLLSIIILGGGPFWVGRGGRGWGRGEGEVRWVGRESSFGLVGRCKKRWARKVLRAGCWGKALKKGVFKQPLIAMTLWQDFVSFVERNFCIS